MRRCIEDVFVKSLKKHKRCMREKGHTGRCAADLTGEVFGSIRVIKPAPPYKMRGRTATLSMWHVNQKGISRIVRTWNLTSGKSKGMVDYHGYTTGGMCFEYAVVCRHHDFIFNKKSPNHKYYKGMKFFDDWNPRKGGAIWKGAKWIMENLGKRPSPKWSLDVIDHHIGFAPGNLRWATANTQKSNQRHRILGRFTVKEIRVEARRHGYKLVKI